MTLEVTNDEGQHDKYFHVLPNMYDDDLDPFEYRLIGHYKRVGVSWEGTRKIAKITKMSLGKVVKTRQSLEDKKLIRVEYLTRKELKDRGFDIKEKKPDDKVKIVVTAVRDVMAENIARYQVGVHVVNTPVHSMNTPVHEVNERITPELKPEKKVSERDALLKQLTPYLEIAHAILISIETGYDAIMHKPNEYMTNTLIKKYLPILEELTRLEATPAELKALYGHFKPIYDKNGWTFGISTFSNKLQPYRTLKPSTVSVKPSNILDSKEPTEAERLALAEARKNIRPEWEKKAVNE